MPKPQRINIRTLSVAPELQDRVATFAVAMKTEEDMQRVPPIRVFRDGMPRPDDEPLRVDDRLLAETQGRINAVFQDDLIFPVYVIKAPEPHPGYNMAVSGGASSLYYRDNIADWQGPGFVLKVHQAETTRTNFHGTILHEITHCCQLDMATPWSCLPEEMGFPAFQKEQLRPVFPSAYQTYLAHRLDFWRLCGHVWTRGIEVFPCRFSDLGITWVRPDDMLAALAPEIKRERHAPLWQIARRPVPRDFATLFEFDPKDWNKCEYLTDSINPMEKVAYDP